MEDEIPATDQLALINVAEQMVNLRTHEIVREREAAGSLKLIGLFIDLEEARVFVYDEADQRFRRVRADQMPIGAGLDS